MAPAMSDLQRIVGIALRIIVRAVQTVEFCLEHTVKGRESPLFCLIYLKPRMCMDHKFRLPVTAYLKIMDERNVTYKPSR
jgi:hypothetical protein